MANEDPTPLDAQQVSDEHAAGAAGVKRVDPRWRTWCILAALIVAFLGIDFLAGALFGAGDE
jgi:hypothetical protein